MSPAGPGSPRSPGDPGGPSRPGTPLKGRCGKSYFPTANETPFRVLIHTYDKQAKHIE